MAVSKSVRRFLLNLVRDLMGLSPDVFSVVDMVRDDSTPDEITSQVEDYLDENHPGEGKRWNDLGYKYRSDAEHLKYNLERQYELLDEFDE